MRGAGITRRAVLSALPPVALITLSPVALRWGRSGGALIGTPVPAGPTPPLALSKTDGRPFDLAAEHGRLILVYFGYTRCPDVCPTTLADVAAALAHLSAGEAARVRVAFVSLDPAADPAPALQGYLESFGPSPPFVGLTGSPKAVARAAAAWGVTWRKAEGGFFDHSSFVTAVDPGGIRRLRYGYAQTQDPVALAHDLSVLLHDA